MNKDLYNGVIKREQRAEEVRTTWRVVAATLVGVGRMVSEQMKLGPSSLAFLTQRN